MKVTGIREKINCPCCGGWKIKKNGSYTRHRNRRKVQRYRCLGCQHTFSDQTRSPTYRQKRPELLETILRAMSNSQGVRRIAADVGTTVTTVQRKVKILHKLCESFHQKHMSQWKRKPTFQFDEAWSVEANRWQALTVPIVIEKESYFIVAARAAYDYCRSGRPDVKGIYDNRKAGGIAEQEKIIKRTIKKCLLMKPTGTIRVDTDKKSTYPKIISDVIGNKLAHIRYNAGDEDEKKKLFPVNNAIACLRAEKAMMRRESWYITKDKDWLNRRLSFYIFYYNYVRLKRYTVTKEKYEALDPKTGEIIEKVSKTFVKMTPAMHLGIFDKPISFDSVLKSA